MNIWQFASNSPWLAFFLAWIFMYGCIGCPFRALNRWIRHRNIVVRGWPPEHLNADGDWGAESEKDY